MEQCTFVSLYRATSPRLETAFIILLLSENVPTSELRHMRSTEHMKGQRGHKEEKLPKKRI